MVHSRRVPAWDLIEESLGGLDIGGQMGPTLGHIQKHLPSFTRGKVRRERLSARFGR
jgi:hypothetical protein